MDRKSVCLMVFSLFSLQNAFCAEVVDAPVQGEDLNASGRSAYWTPDRIRNAKALSVSVQRNDSRKFRSRSENSSGVLSARNGANPDASSSSLSIELFPAEKSGISVSSHTIKKIRPAYDAGSSFFPFSSSRLVPGSANVVYPYTTIGKLYFTIPSKGDYICSAAVLSQRIIITAGHCVHSGTNGNEGFYKNFMFVPAYRNGSAPFGEWMGNYAAVHAEWANGGGSLPNEADIGMIELKDQSVDGVKTRIFHYTGYLGYQTESLDRNHANLVGYANNLDSGEQMHQVAGETGRTVAAKNVEYGSDMREGSDGSPWIQNFGQYGAGQDA